MPITYQQSLDKIAQLVKQFNTNRAAYLAPGFKEAQARQALIDPLFIALGWDVHNSEHAAPDYQFVLVEEPNPAHGHQRPPTTPSARASTTASSSPRPRSPVSPSRAAPTPATSCAPMAGTRSCRSPSSPISTSSRSTTAAASRSPINLSDRADKTRHDRMVSLVERMLELHKRLHDAGSDSEREVMQRQIDATDRQIDALVYELYGLTAEEVAVVEG